MLQNSPCYEIYKTETLTHLMKFVSFWGDGVILPISLVLVAGLVFYLLKEKIWAAAIVVSPLVGELIKQFLKNYFRNERPSARGCVDLTGQNGFSFPSGHTTFYVIFFGLITYYLLTKTKSKVAKIASIFPIIMVLSVGYSRVYLGAHWVRDVAAGYALGFIILIITILILKTLKINRNIY